MTIPTIDLAGLDTDAGRARIAHEMDRAYSRWGFAYIVNHGVDPGLVDSVFDAAHRFHALPAGAKEPERIGSGYRKQQNH